MGERMEEEIGRDPEEYGFATCCCMCLTSQLTTDAA